MLVIEIAFFGAATIKLSPHVDGLRDARDKEKLFKKNKREFVGNHVSF